MPTPGGSLTGSLRQGVSRLAWEFSAQAKPAPDSATRAPKPGFANTFTPGAGGRARAPGAHHRRPGEGKGETRVTVGQRLSRAQEDAARLVERGVRRVALDDSP